MTDYAIARAAHLLRAGGVVVNATEGVWGLCCDPWRESAVSRLLHAKRRSWREGLILVASRAETFAPLVRDLPQDVLQLISETWPGPVTWLVPHRARVPAWIHGESDCVALRVTAHPQFRELCRRFDGALTSSSANRAGQPSIDDADAARAHLKGDVDFVLSGELGGQAGASTIIDARTLEIRRGTLSSVPALQALLLARGAT